MPPRGKNRLSAQPRPATGIWRQHPREHACSLRAELRYRCRLRFALRLRSQKVNRPRPSTVIGINIAHFLTETQCPQKIDVAL
jgi:hypothetical protein